MAGGKAKYVGVDGCKGGWFSVGLGDDDGLEVDMEMFPSFRDLVEHYSDAKLILVDMPIGLFDQGKPKLRECDAEAREVLKSRNSLFIPPSRTLAEVVNHRVKALGHIKARDQLKADGYSKGWEGFAQAVGITPKIHEVDEFMSERGNNPSPKIREVHPEICFWALNDERILDYPKNDKSHLGICERVRVLKCFVNAEGIYTDAILNQRRKDVGRDDILDAIVAAVTAKLWCKHPDIRRKLPESPPTDSKNLPMEMVYVESRKAE